MLTFLKALFIGSGSWIAYLVVAAVIFGAGATSGSIVRSRLDAPIISGLKADVAIAQKDTETEKARYNKLAADYNAAEAKAEANRADANAKAAEQSSKDSKTITDLQAKLTAEQTLHARTSAQLTAELNHALSSEDRDLGPASIRFFAGVRDRQANGRNGP